jgi:hypothetical protein
MLKTFVEEKEKEDIKTKTSENILKQDIQDCIRTVQALTLRYCLTSMIGTPQVDRDKKYETIRKRYALH